MTQEYYHRLYQYDYWANQEVIESLSVASPPEKAISLLGHIFAAQQIWLARLKEQDSSVFTVWPDFTLAECRGLMESMERQWAHFLDDLPPARYPETVAYRNTAGESFQTPRGEILTHVIIHGGYHRGQIATLLRQQDNPAAVTDFIAFVR